MCIHPMTRIGLVDYKVADLDKQVAFYQDILGLTVNSHDGDSATLGTAKRELLRLKTLPGARRVRQTTGLYHTAFLVPTRWELANLLRQVVRTGTRIQGTSNHGTHLAIYLPDPEGNGIELAWDTPKEQWPMRDGMLLLEEMPREGIDLEDLLSELERNPAKWEGVDAETTVGHIHLHVADIKRSQHFYAELLGFDVTMKSRTFGGLFLSAGGYHHHIGLNIWHGVDAPAPPPDATGLRYFTVDVPDHGELNQVLARLDQGGFQGIRLDEGTLFADPSGNGVLLRVGA